ncbi:MAG: hypothetical protein ACH346_00625 [Chthoniobacterales bacterium]
MKKPLGKTVLLFCLIFSSLIHGLEAGEVKDYRLQEEKEAMPVVVSSPISHLLSSVSCAVTAAQYCDFLNAVAASDPHALYHEAMETDPDRACIVRMGGPGSFYYEVIAGREDSSICYVDFFAQARYCNWLENGEQAGEEGVKSLEEGAYTLNGLDKIYASTSDAIISKNEGASYWIADSNDDITEENATAACSSDFIADENCGFSIAMPQAPMLTLVGKPAVDSMASSDLNSSSYWKDVVGVVGIGGLAVLGYKLMPRIACETEVSANERDSVPQAENSVEVLSPEENHSVTDESTIPRVPSISRIGEASTVEENSVRQDENRVGVPLPEIIRGPIPEFGGVRIIKKYNKQLIITDEEEVDLDEFIDEPIKGKSSNTFEQKNREIFEEAKKEWEVTKSQEEVPVLSEGDMATLATEYNQEKNDSMIKMINEAKDAISQSNYSDAIEKVKKINALASVYWYYYNNQGFINLANSMKDICQQGADNTSDEKELEFFKTQELYWKLESETINRLNGIRERLKEAINSHQTIDSLTLHSELTPNDSESTKKLEDFFNRTKALDKDFQSNLYAWHESRDECRDELIKLAESMKDIYKQIVDYSNLALKNNDIQADDSKIEEICSLANQYYDDWNKYVSWINSTYATDAAELNMLYENKICYNLARNCIQNNPSSNNVSQNMASLARDRLRGGGSGSKITQLLFREIKQNSRVASLLHVKPILDKKLALRDVSYWNNTSDSRDAYNLIHSNNNVTDSEAEEAIVSSNDEVPKEHFFDFLLFQDRQKRHQNLSEEYDKRLEEEDRKRPSISGLFQRGNFFNLDVSRRNFSTSTSGGVRTENIRPGESEVPLKSGDEDERKMKKVEQFVTPDVGYDPTFGQEANETLNPGEQISFEESLYEVRRDIEIRRSPVNFFLKRTGEELIRDEKLVKINVSTQANLNNSSPGLSSVSRRNFSISPEFEKLTIKISGVYDEFGQDSADLMNSGREAENVDVPAGIKLSYEGDILEVLKPIMLKQRNGYFYFIKNLELYKKNGEIQIDPNVVKLGPTIEI